MKKIALLTIAALLTGCAGMKPLPPAFYATATATAISVGLRNSPETAAQLRTVQPYLCQTVSNKALTPEQIQDSLNSANYNANTLAIINSVSLLYIAAFNQLSTTNQAALQPYATAIFCDGFAAGLSMSPGVKSRSAPATKIPLWVK